MVGVPASVRVAAIQARPGSFSASVPAAGASAYLGVPTPPAAAGSTSSSASLRGTLRSRGCASPSAARVTATR